MTFYGIMLLASVHFIHTFHGYLNPDLIKYMYLVSRSKDGKAAAYVKKATRDLIQARRESGHGDKV